MFTARPLNFLALVMEYPVEEETGYFKTFIEATVDNQSRRRDPGISFSIYKMVDDKLFGKQQRIHMDSFNANYFTNLELSKRFHLLWSGLVIGREATEIVNLCFISLIMNKEYVYEFDNLIWFKEFPWLHTLQENLNVFYQEEIDRLSKLVKNSIKFDSSFVNTNSCEIKNMSEIIFEPFSEDMEIGVLLFRD